MEIQITKNSGITTLKVNLLDAEIERIINTEMTDFERSVFMGMWKGDLIRKFKALGWIITLKDRINKQTSYSME